MKRKNFCYVLIALLLLCMTGCGTKQILAEVDNSVSVDPNAFNHLASRDWDTDPSIFWFDEENEVSYFVNRASDYYIYQLKGNESKLVVDIPAQELWMHDGLLYFMVENYDNRELVDMHLGDIYCYNPKKDTVELVYAAGAMDEKSVGHELKVNENGIYFSYKLKEEENSTSGSSRYRVYSYYLPFGATEPVKDELEMTMIGWEDYKLFCMPPWTLVSRTEETKDTKELSIKAFQYCIVGDMLYSVGLGDCKLYGLNLRTDERIEYDFSELIYEEKDLVTGEEVLPSGLVVFHSFVIKEKELWLAGTSRLYHMDLETGEQNCYILENEDCERMEIRTLYTAGDELYVEINPSRSGMAYRLVRVKTDEIRTSDYTVDGKHEVFIRMEELTKIK